MGVPEFTIHHMAEAFEWPPEEQESRSGWEARCACCFLDAGEHATTRMQVEKLLSMLPGRLQPIPPADGPAEPEQPSAAQAIEVRLRRVISCALKYVPHELRASKS